MKRSQSTAQNLKDLGIQTGWVRNETMVNLNLDAGPISMVLNSVSIMSWKQLDGFNLEKNKYTEGSETYSDWSFGFGSKF